VTVSPGYPDPDRDRSSFDPTAGGSGEFDDRDVDARFTAIVSGISVDMHWDVTEADLDARATDRRETTGWGIGPDGAGYVDDGDIDDYDDFDDDGTDTAEARRRRRELRRQERAEALAAHLEAQAELEAQMAADDEHFVPPPPPPLPRLRRRTVAALLLIAAGILLLSWPALLPADTDLIMVVALLLILVGAGVLVAGMRRHRGDPGEGWDDGAEV
jgi:hypothetical protein